MAQPSTTPNPGETNLTTLLSTLTTTLHPKTYLFLTFPPPTTVYSLPHTLPLQMTFQETTGLTVITPADAAAAHGYYHDPTNPESDATGNTTINDSDKSDDATTQSSPPNPLPATAFPCRMITLNVHSSLDAVGFMAVVAGELKKLDMGVNPVSGFFHDHLFVPEGKEGEAVRCLEGVAGRAKGGEIWG